MSANKIVLLDACAMVKLLFVNEVGRTAVITAMREAEVRITDVCIVEALGALKRKRGKEFDGEGYYLRTLILSTLTKTKIKVITTNLSDPSTYFDCEDISKKYKIDLIDALQIVSLKQALKAANGTSRMQLVTADTDLCTAAKQENLNVVLCQD